MDKCSQLREEMVEAAAEANEELMDAYLESGELSEDQIKRYLDDFMTWARANLKDILK